MVVILGFLMKEANEDFVIIYETADGKWIKHT